MARGDQAKFEKKKAKEKALKAARKVESLKSKNDSRAAKLDPDAIRKGKAPAKDMSEAFDMFRHKKGKGGAGNRDKKLEGHQKQVAKAAAAAVRK